MKKVLTILLTILLIFAVGCAVQEKVNETPAHVVEANHDVADTDEPEAPRVSVSAAERVSLTYDSVEKMIEAIQTERQAKSKDGMAKMNKLEELSAVYVPPESLGGRSLLFVEVSPNAVRYYYMPEGSATSGFSYTEGILVSTYREPRYNPRTFFSDNSLAQDEDGFAYDEEMREMTFIQDDGIISIRVPEELNSYNTLRGFCEIEKIELPWPEGEGNTRESENEITMPQFSSVDELISAVQAERQSELKSALAQSGELESLSFLYVPSDIIAGYFLHEIKVTPDYVILNMPHEEEVEPYLEWECVIFTQYRSEDVTLQSICDQYGLSLNEDSRVYDEENRRVFYEEDNTVISMQVPEYMNDYETMLIISEMEKIEIP